MARTTLDLNLASEVSVFTTGQRERLAPEVRISVRFSVRFRDSKRVRVRVRDSVSIRAIG